LNKSNHTIEKRKSNRESSIKGFRIIRSPKFEFTNLPDTERLTYEVLDKTNYFEVHKVFKDDGNPFVITEYKQLDKLEHYVDFFTELCSSKSRASFIEAMLHKVLKRGFIN